MKYKVCFDLLSPRGTVSRVESPELVEGGNMTDTVEALAVVMKSPWFCESFYGLEVMKVVIDKIEDVSVESQWPL